MFEQPRAVSSATRTPAASLSSSHLLALLVLTLVAGCGGGGGGDSSPVANPDTYASNVGQLTVSRSSPGVLGNDSGSGITAELVSGPSFAASFTLNQDGSFTYVHSSTSSAITDSFSYRAKNGTSASNPTSVTLNITPPVAVADTYSMNAPSGTVSGNVLGNDTPATGLTVEQIGPNPAQAASFSFNLTNGTFSYQHNGGDAASVSFQYRTKVGAITSNTVTVTININQPPLAFNVCPSIINNQASIDINPTTFSLGLDPNGTFPTYVIDTQPSHGTVVTNAQGGFTYTPSKPSPDTGRRGMDKFMFRAQDALDPSLISAPATVSILNNGKVRIMPLGDSITAGFPGGSAATDLWVGYRRKLFKDLENASPNYGVDFVGGISTFGATAWPDTDTPVDRDHEGHDGWCDDNTPFCNPSGGQTIAANVTTWLNQNPADIILLHIGTNQFSTDASGVNTILNNINTWAQANYPVTVFLARIIKTVNDFIPDADIAQFNTNVDAIDGNRAAVKIYPVDQTNGAGLTYTLGVDMGDSVHPNQSGYDKMADKWKADITAAGVLPSCP
jgi:lysophospholipase L1-like esterase